MGIIWDLEDAGILGGFLMLTNTHLEALCIAAATGSKSQKKTKKKTIKNQEVLITNTIRTVENIGSTFCVKLHRLLHSVWPKGCRCSAHTFLNRSITRCRLPKENRFSGRPVNFTSVFLCERLKAKVQLLPLGFFLESYKEFSRENNSEMSRFDSEAMGGCFLFSLKEKGWWNPFLVVAVE